jgi:glycosyltransferase involved in cell wall biosynthesis
MGALGQKICLSMIVKNEAPVIRRCFESVLPIIDYWVIVDTGSTDGTQGIVKEFANVKPGELHERPWVDFAYNRTEALNLAKGHGHYTLIIDADDVLELKPGFKMSFLTADSYLVDIRQMELRYSRVQLVRSSLPWRYEGVLHEFLSCGRNKYEQRIFPENRPQQRLTGAVIRMTEGGARRRTSAVERFSRDAALLERALETESDPFLFARYKFYLAQSYQNAGEKVKALENYEERAKLGLWREEVFVSLYQAAKLKVDLNATAEDIIQSYLNASAVSGVKRAEALHGAARFCRSEQRFQEGYEYAKKALRIGVPEQALFLERWIYDYGILDEYAVNAYGAGRYADCLKACEKLLREGKIPKEEHNRVEQNARFARERLT